jgi:hypothetical protein
MQVMIAVCRNGKTQYEPLCFMGLQPHPDITDGGFVVLGGLTEIQNLVESGKISPPEGYISPKDSDLGYDDDKS